MTIVDLVLIMLFVVLWVVAGQNAVDFMAIHYSLRNENFPRKKKIWIRALGLFYWMHSAGVLTEDLVAMTKRLREMEGDSVDEGRDFLSASDFQ
jgi:hypothetical protein